MATIDPTKHLFVANLQSVSLEELVKSKLQVFFSQHKSTDVELDGLYNIVVGQVEKPLIELALERYSWNQVRTAKALGINRNTLKKKITDYRIKLQRSKSRRSTGGSARQTT